MYVVLWEEEVLDLHYNGQMNGTLPDSMYNLENMRIMILSRNSFEGSINSDIGNMKNLTEFRINDNFFTGTLPSELGLCKNLGKDIDIFLFRKQK